MLVLALARVLPALALMSVYLVVLMLVRVMKLIWLPPRCGTHHRVEKSFDFSVATAPE